MIVRQGKCPECSGEGQVGHPCPEPSCERRGLHHVPEEHLPSGERKLPDLLVGQLLGDYLVARPLGAGAFGKVYLGLQLPILLEAAIKLLDVAGFPDSMRSSLLSRFETEARALAVVQHPNVVRLLHYGSFLDQPYLVTDYVADGLTLEHDIIRRAGRGVGYDREELGELLGQLLAGLMAVHDLGIVHRDIKPANLMIQDLRGYPSVLRILDFGLAKFLERGDQTYIISGSPDYMAPEQFTLDPLGPWTDIYAVGVLAYELLTGQKPFAALTPKQMMYQKIRGDRDPLDRIAALNLPAEAMDLLSRALARDPDHRYRSAGAMKTGLDKALGALAGWTSPIGPVRLDALVDKKIGSDQETTALISGMKVAADEAPVGSEEAFNQWLEQEHGRLQLQERKDEK